MHELQHHLFELALTHLPVANQHTRGRNHALKFGRNFPYRINAVVHEVHLAATLQFLLHR